VSAASTVYGGRYEILERVGTGGMAEVYRARDDLLGREVAVKVLSERFARDSSFVERFRREARSAANLNHPNIVSLYDYGSDNGTYFIVMEYIDGRPLDDIVHRDGALLPERAAEIASDVALALSRAHTGGLVHRDVKPSNIMITANGQTKVTDFGIARAVTGNGDQTVTQTGMVIGTAAYLSPEQAQGRPVDARSDVYALGCVLYEMLAGRPPFTGESPLSIAYKHVREDAVPPSRVNSDVPDALDAVVMKAMAKNPDNRYPSAAEMKQDLDRFLGGQRVEATPVMADDTMVTSTPGDTRVLREPAYEPAPRRRRALPWILGALLLLVLLGGLAWFLLDSSGARVPVPDLTGMTEGKAVQALDDRGLEADIRREFSDERANRVFRQVPDAGSRIDEGSTVTVFVSRGLRQIKVPDLTGMTRGDAETALQREGLRLGQVARAPNDTVPEDQIFQQSIPAGERVDQGTRIDVSISAGPELVVVPFVEGQLEEDAIADIQGADLVARVQTGPSADVEEGRVIGQEPPGGTEVEPGSVVVILVSSGLEETPLPDVTGQEEEAAIATLQEIGLQVDTQDETAECVQPPGTVCRTEPQSGTPVSEGDEVTLFIQPSGGEGD
jgi:beta-lactam-binding protein with PASTA domain/tRNA A-37 threonylcarbamoyl transferase component Bud32